MPLSLPPKHPFSFLIWESIPSPVSAHKIKVGSTPSREEYMTPPLGKGVGSRASPETLRLLKNGLPGREQNLEKDIKKSFEPLEQATAETHYMWTVHCVKLCMCMCMHIFIFAQVVLCYVFVLQRLLKEFFGGGIGICSNRRTHSVSPTNPSLTSASFPFHQRKGKLQPQSFVFILFFLPLQLVMAIYGKLPYFLIYDGGIYP